LVVFAARHLPKIDAVFVLGLGAQFDGAPLGIVQSLGLAAERIGSRKHPPVVGINGAARRNDAASTGQHGRLLVRRASNVDHEAFELLGGCDESSVVIHTM
jgi:hypothetical protein